MKAVENIKVLMVDDETEFLASASKALTRRGLTVYTASNADLAYGILEQNPIDVILLDVKMPDADGHELFYEFKSKYPSVQIIMLTGHGDVQRAFEMSRDGLFDYVSKPCNIDQLSLQIRNAAKKGNGKKEAKVPEEASIRVLIVDDEKEFVDATSKVLARRGLVVTKASGGKEALEIIRNRKIDVAVVDIKMPDMDGLELLSHIKQVDPEIKVILLTGHATMDSGIAAMRAGASDYLFKPHDPNKLAQKIKAAGQKK